MICFVTSPLGVMQISPLFSSRLPLPHFDEITLAQSGFVSTCRNRFGLPHPDRVRDPGIGDFSEIWDPARSLLGPPRKQWKRKNRKLCNQS